MSTTKGFQGSGHSPSLWKRTKTGLAAVLALTVIGSGCSYRPTPKNSSIQYGTYIPITPLTIDPNAMEPTPRSYFATTQSFDSDLELDVKAKISWYALLTGSYQGGEYRRTTDVGNFVTCAVEYSIEDKPASNTLPVNSSASIAFLVLGYGARAEFLMTYNDGQLTVAPFVDAKGSVNTQATNVITFGIDTPIASLMIPTSAKTSEAFSEATTKALSVMKLTDSATSCLIRPIIFGIIIYDDVEKKPKSEIERMISAIIKSAAKKKIVVKTKGGPDEQHTIFK